MKILCLILVFVNVILFGVAGFRLLTTEAAPARDMNAQFRVESLVPQSDEDTPRSLRIRENTEAEELPGDRSYTRRTPPSRDAEAEAMEDDYTFGDRNEYDVEDYLDEGDTEMKQEGLDDAKGKIQNLPFGKN